METSLTQIGNSRGVIIPAHFLKACNLEGRVDLSVENGRLVLSSLRRPRHDWEERIKAAGMPELTPEDREWLDMKGDEETLKDWTW
jgi:antitoxin MazE